MSTSKPFGWQDKLGYLIGDVGNSATFIFASSFLMLFYTDVLGIPAVIVGTMFFISKLIAAVADIVMGRVVDVVPAGKGGKYLPWLRRMMVPVALASFLMYQTAFKDASLTVRIVYMYLTYNLWQSVTYPAINIPYGSLAATITAKPNERTALSTFRNIGAKMAQLILGFLTPFFIYTRTASGQQVVKQDNTFTIIAGCFAVLAIVSYYLCYRMTTERVPALEQTEKSNLLIAIKRIMKNKAVISLLLTSIFLSLGQNFIGMMNNYIFPVYFNSATGVSITNVVSPLLIILVVSPLAINLTNRFGKKEVSGITALLAAAIYGLLFVIKTQNMFAYIMLAGIAFALFGFYNATMYAKVTDVIDDIEVESHYRDGGTVYALYSFSRKIGQAFSGAISGYALSVVGYQSAFEHSQTTLNGIYNATTLVPAISFIFLALVLFYLYPLSKERVEENSQLLVKRHLK